MANEIVGAKAPIKAEVVTNAVITNEIHRV